MLRYNCKLSIHCACRHIPSGGAAQRPLTSNSAASLRAAMGPDVPYAHQDRMPPQAPLEPFTFPLGEPSGLRRGSGAGAGAGQQRQPGVPHGLCWCVKHAATLMRHAMPWQCAPSACARAIVVACCAVLHGCRGCRQLHWSGWQPEQGPFAAVEQAQRLGASACLTYHRMACPVTMP